MPVVLGFKPTWVIIKNISDNGRHAKHCSGTSSHSKLQQVFKWQNFKVLEPNWNAGFRLIPIQWFI